MLSELFAEITASLSADDRAVRLAELADEREELLEAAHKWVAATSAWGFVIKSAACGVGDVVPGDIYSTERVSSFASQGPASAAFVRGGGGGGGGAVGGPGM